MAILDRTHPDVAEFKLRGQAIALLQRSLNRFLTETERTQFSANSMLGGTTPDSVYEARKSLLAELLQDQQRQDTKIAELAGQARAKAADVAAQSIAAIAQEKFVGSDDATLIAARDDLVKVIDAKRAELDLLMAEIQRRDRMAEMLKKLGGVTDTDKAMLLQLLSPDGVATTTKIGAPGAN